MESTETPGQIRLSQTSNIHYSALESTKAHEQISIASSFECPLLCFGKHKGPWDKWDLPRLPLFTTLLWSAQRPHAQSRLNQTSSTDYSALESTKAPWTTQTKSDFEYCILCFGKHEGPVGSQTKSDFEYCLLCLVKQKGPLVNQTKSDFGYCTLCFGTHKGPWTNQTTSDFD